MQSSPGLRLRLVGQGWMRTIRRLGLVLFAILESFCKTECAEWRRVGPQTETG